MSGNVEDGFGDSTDGKGPYPGRIDEKNGGICADDMGWAVRIVDGKRLCARPGCKDEEYRIDGYCGCYCRDMHVIEHDHEALQKIHAKLIVDFAAVDGCWEKKLRLVGELLDSLKWIADDHWKAQCFEWKSAPEGMKVAANKEAREGFNEIFKMIAGFKRPRPSPEGDNEKATS